MPWSLFRKKNTFDISDPSDRNSFFCIVAIFNPIGYTSRYELYHKFACHMQDCGVQLMTVEAIFPSLGQTQFSVTQPDNPLHVQITSNSVYWMKENLINVGVSRLPSHAKWVAWLDADLTFHSKNWVKQVISALKQYEVVQVFKKAKFLGPPPSSKVLRTDYSFGYSVVHNKVIDQQRYAEWYPHPGYGWAMSINSFRAIGGLPVYDIVGSGDLHFAFSLLNRVSNAIEDQLHPDFIAHILKTSTSTYETLSSIAKATGKSSLVGYTPVTISHNWHGSRSDRQYVDRWKILIAHQFNFQTDVVTTETGLLEFVGDKGNTLQADILAHFRIRKEDGKQVNGQDLAVTAAAAAMIVKQKKKQRRKSSLDDSDQDHQMRMAQFQQQQQSYSGDKAEWIPPPPTDPNCPYPCLPNQNCHPDQNCPPEHGNGHDPNHGGGYPDGGHYHDNSIHTSTQY